MGGPVRGVELGTTPCGWNSASESRTRPLTLRDSPAFSAVNTTDEATSSALEGVTPFACHHIRGNTPTDIGNLVLWRNIMRDPDFIGVDADGIKYRLWNVPINVIPATRRDMLYGTPEMAEELKRLLLDTSSSIERLTVMGGHEGGLIFVGGYGQGRGEGEG